MFLYQRFLRGRRRADRDRKAQNEDFCSSACPSLASSVVFCSPLVNGLYTVVVDRSPMGIFESFFVQKRRTEPLSVGAAEPVQRRPLIALQALLEEQPSCLMARVRQVAPQIDVALRAGHTLRAVCERLNRDGLEISYACLVQYRARMRREKRIAATAGPAAVHSPHIQRADVPIQGTFDPAANLKRQEEKRFDWKYPSGPPDEKALF